MAVNLLLSYAFHAGTDLTKVRKDLVCGLLLIDSGAFTAHTTGKQISLAEYAEYLEAFRGCWDHAVTLDVIGDPEGTARNTARLHARGIPVMPVFTRGGKLADFDAMVRDCGYVCAGGLVGLPKDVQTKRVGLLQQRARDLGGGIHALGIGSVEVLRKTRPYSADASSISGAFRFGSLIYFTGTAVRTIPVANAKRMKKDHDVIRAHGVDLALLARTGRMPGKGDREKLMQAMSLAYACADEWLKRVCPVPAPRDLQAPGVHLFNSVAQATSSTGSGSAYADAVAQLDSRLHPGPHLYNSVPTGDLEAAQRLDQVLHPGPHLYSSVAEGWLLNAASPVDRQVHSQDLPEIWRRYGRTHTCYRRTASHVPS